ncbi:MAG: M15 family metallopeptidase [Fibrobacter sp.]|nr:M15 family metallopeptidase [Fibrobacter sp.]
MTKTEAILGLNQEYLQLLSTGKSYLHSEVLPHWQALQKRARQAGYNLTAASAWRSFERQLAIWNGKALGKIPVYDRHSQAMDLSGLDDEQKVAAILIWSALPGTSRHHWGTDIDVYDAIAVPEGYEVQLTPEESAGPFAPLHAWLDQQIAAENCEGFYRPFVPGVGAIQPERWHLSHLPTAHQWQKHFDPERLRQLLAASDLELKDAILATLPQILEQYVYPYWQEDL